MADMEIIRFDLLETGLSEYDANREPERIFDHRNYTVSHKVRNILRHNGKFCLIYSEGENYYTFPGGSVESGEDSSQAVLRETAEETGAILNNLQKIGETREFRQETGLLQITDYYESALERQAAPALTEEEVRLGTTMLWVDAKTCIQLLRGQESGFYHRKFSGIRDFEMFRRYMLLHKAAGI